MHAFKRAIICIIATALLSGCGPKERHLTVTATAFNSTRAQTDSRPSEAACGSRIAPGDKVVAVSRDLEAAGLTCGKAVQIAGMEGEWVVMDRMASDRKMHIDLYMGRDVKAAREWGVQRVEIQWAQ